MAVIKPTMVTSKALSLREVGIVRIGVFVGKKFDVIMTPAMMLPQASRLIGFITIWLFSFVGTIGVERGCPIRAK